MNLESKKISLLILALTAIVSSRFLFFLFNDPEGPNLLVVSVTAAIVFLVSLAAYIFSATPSLTGFKRLFLAIGAQIVVIGGLYVFLS
jgi:hypothetical protein